MFCASIYKFLGIYGSVTMATLLVLAAMFGGVSWQLIIVCTHMSVWEEIRSYSE